MLRRLSATPCPPANIGTDPARRDSIASTTTNETTANLDYTTEFKALFHDTKPRRQPTAVVKPNVSSLGFVIHEDEELRVEFSVSQNGRPQRRSVISQPAQRPRNRLSIMTSKVLAEVEPSPQAMRSSISRPPRRQSLATKDPHPHNAEYDGHTLPQIPSPKISKPARRGTIYIPADDTTMPSMYMGIFSPLKNGDNNTEEEAGSIGMNCIATQMAMKRHPRKSLLASHPKRNPLGTTIQTSQTNVEQNVGVRSGPGKENVPPGFPLEQNQLSRKISRISIAPVYQPVWPQPMNSRPSSRLFDQTASSSARLKQAQRNNVRPPKARIEPPGNLKPLTNGLSTKISPRPTEPMPFKEIRPKEVGSVRLLAPSLPANSVLSDFPLVPEGLPDVSMYEDTWLSQQEVAITQLVNSLFEAASPNLSAALDHDLLRLKLLEHYGSPEMALLYKRIHGALLYGALSISKEAIACGPRLETDLGRQRAFINLWLQSYNHNLLGTALEVVVGRLVGCKAVPALDSTKPLRRAIVTFLIMNEDINPDPDCLNLELWRFQRTLLRSMMLIKVLDLTKTIKDLTPVPNLFRTDSQHKSSISVLQQLIRMLNPSVGDPIRPLSHLGFTISHSQYPLEEYNYQITNLAIDMRDGVRITRLVELLLYRSASSALSHCQDSEGTSTLQIPGGETLSLTEGNQDWPLSQYLKFPCLGRATRLYNNQIAITALQGIKGISTLFREVSAEDIVDGYREKTVRLLWALTSKWGLGGLVDWQDVKTEVRRLERSQGRPAGEHLNDWDFDEDDPGYMQYKSLLKTWARAIASGHGLTVRNFTTSFADGKVFEAIVNEYQPFLLGSSTLNSEGGFDARLKALGCSDQFVRLFATIGGHYSTRLAKTLGWSPETEKRRVAEPSNILRC
jgi:abnormal spindle-like microcephaly-associated protein